MEDTSAEVAQRMFELNVLGPLALTRAALPFLLSRRHTRIVVVSSMAAVVPAPGGTPWCLMRLDNCALPHPCMKRIAAQLAHASSREHHAAPKCPACCPHRAQHAAIHTQQLSLSRMWLPGRRASSVQRDQARLAWLLPDAAVGGQ